MNVKNVPAALKILNRKIFYQLISREGGLSRADIARKTGISGATVIKIAEYLAGRGIISYDAAESLPLPGRKPSPIRFNPDFAFIIAVYMEGFYASMGLLNAAGGVILSREFKVPNVDNFIRKKFYREIDSLIVSGGIDGGKIIGIGMAIPAALDSKTRHVYRLPLPHAVWLANLEALSSELFSRYKVPIFVENDVNAAAYGEYRNVYSETTDSLVYVSLGSGLGGGLILNRKLWKGQNASAGEFGYMDFERDRKLRKTSENSPPAGMGWLEGKTGLAALKEIFDFDIQAPRDPQKEAKIIPYLSRYIGLAILNINAVLDIKTVVLGGILADFFSDALVDAVRKEMKKTSPYTPLVVPGKLRNPSFAGLSHIIMDELLDELLSR